MSNDNWFGVEPPRDAEGREIPLCTKTMYFLDGEKINIRTFEYWPREHMWRVTVGGSYTHYATSDLMLFPPDSWEKIEEETKMGPCHYAHAPRDEYGITVCRECRFQKGKSCRQEMLLDIIARAKKLAGIEEQEGGERTAIADKEER